MYTKFQIILRWWCFWLCEMVWNASPVIMRKLSETETRNENDIVLERGVRVREHSACHCWVDFCIFIISILISLYIWAFGLTTIIIIFPMFSQCTINEMRILMCRIASNKCPGAYCLPGFRYTVNFVIITIGNPVWQLYWLLIRS